MSVERILVPRLNSNDEYADLVYILSPPAYVERGDVIAVLETTKASFEVEATRSGTFKSNLQTGGEVMVGSVIGIITDEDSSGCIGKDYYSEAQDALSDVDSLSSDNLATTRSNSLSNIGMQLHKTSTIGLNTVIARISEKYRGPSISCDDFWIHPSAQISPSATFRCDKIFIDKNCIIGDNVVISTPNLRMGKYSRIERECYVDSAGHPDPEAGLYLGEKSLVSGFSYINCCRRVSIGDDSALSPRCSIFTHMFWNSIYEGFPSRFSQVIIGRNVWLGPNTVVLPGVQVANGVMVAPNSTIDSSIREKNVFLAGGVANPISRPSEESYSSINKKVIKECISHLERTYAGRATNLNVHFIDNRSKYSCETNISHSNYSGQIRILYCDPQSPAADHASTAYGVVIDCHASTIEDSTGLLSDLVLDIYHSVRRYAGIRLSY